MSRPLLALGPLAYLLACLLLAALLAYPIQILIQGRVDVHDLTGRGAEILLVLGLVPLGRWLGITRADMGLDLSAKAFVARLGWGFALGAGMLALHVLLLLALDVRVILPERLESARVLGALQKALLLGLIIGLVEESVFRGFLVGFLRRKAGAAFAATISAFYFGTLHFLRSEMRPRPEDSDWVTGLTLVADALGNLAEIKPDAFLALFAGGIFLACIRLAAPNTSLPACIGIHAGWIFIIKGSKPFTKRTTDPFWSGFASDLDGVIGYLSAAWLSVLIVLTVMAMRKTHPPGTSP